MASPMTAAGPRYPDSQRPQATASSVEPPRRGTPRPQARPFAVAMPMRTPVKDPGPRPTSTRSRSDMERPASERTPSAVVVSSTFAWRRQRWSAQASCSTLGSHPGLGADVTRWSAQASMSVEVSRERTSWEGRESASVMGITWQSVGRARRGRLGIGTTRLV